MVLQRDMPVRIFGRAQPNESVTVTLKDAGGATVRSGRDTAGQSGVFAVTFDASAATDSPLTLVVEGANTITINDVLIGDVWLAGGQSNMEWPVRATGAQAVEAEAAAQGSSIRLLKAPHVTAFRRKSTIDASWTVLSPQTVGDFSAVAFWFARDLQQTLGVPIGILSINWGGTRAEPWVDLATLASHPRFVDQVNEQRAAVETWESTPTALRDRAWREEWKKFQAATGQWWQHVNEGDPGYAAGWFRPEVEAAAAQDSEGWTAVAMPHKWSADPALQAWDGVAWYRRTVDVPAEWAGKECVVELGAIDDCDVLFADGRAVANTVADWATPRRYRIPGSMVKGGPMVLAVQVLDLHGEGGMVSGTPQVTCPSAGSDAIALNEGWLVRKGRTAEGVSPPPERPTRENAPGMRSTDPGAMFHAMIAPFAGFSVRGAIWYQGESNAGSIAEATAYRDLLPLVVRSWRAAFERPDMPFGVVGLAAFRPFEPDQPQSGVWPVLRESQLLAESQVPNVGVVTTIDVGDAADIHPRDKRTVGLRLAQWAKATAYASRGTAWRGPRASRMRIEGETAVLEFDVETPPLAARGGGPVNGFAIAGPDGVFHWADVEIASPNTVRISSPQVNQPKEIRYAWQDNPQNANLVDSTGEQGLPTHPFRRLVGN
ncbi:MAG: hypothetical protein JNK53_05535 [Phycisphaerae bacterium]|nr:hypothetical protein [Phycisphaerae bacterium]